MVSFLCPVNKKPWRRYSRRFSCSHVIRVVCCGVLALELVFFAWELLDGGWYRTECVLEAAAVIEAELEAGPEKTYAIRVRL